MPAIDLMPGFEAKLPKSTHDLSHSFGFSATTAHLLPVFHTIVNPGDKVRIGFSFNLRTMPLQSAAMEEIDTHVEYFFVPFPLLYTPFGSTFYDINDDFSSFVDQSLRMSQYFPLLNFSSAVSAIFANYSSPVISAFDYTNKVDMFAKGAYRLLEHLGYGSMMGQSYWPNSFPYPLLAYQCIYQYYYRLDTRELFNQAAFNWDTYYSQPLVDISGALNDLKNLFTLRYRPQGNDYFSDVKVSPIVDTLNLNNKQLLPTVSDWLSRSYGLSDRPIVVSGDRDGITASSSVGSTQINSDAQNSIQTKFGIQSVFNNPNYTAQNDLNTANIRALFANEKLWSITGRAKKHYDDQTLAHFGFKVPHDPKHEISCFGHDRSTIHIGEVISTASTTEAPLGEIAGKGYAQQHANPHSFVAPCHGVVMAIFSVTPRYRYQNTFLKVNNLTQRTDLPMPAYDHLGMQPIFAYEGYRSAGNNAGNIMGWQYRYEQYKRRFNRLTSIFEVIGSARQGSLQSWMIHKQAWLSFNGNLACTENFADYMYLPVDINNIMLVGYDPTLPVGDTGDPVINANTVYGTDPFVIDSYIDCKLTSWMSDYSLPRLDA